MWCLGWRPIVPAPSAILGSNPLAYSERRVDGPGGGRNSFERVIHGANLPRRGGPFADRYAGSSLSTRRWAERMPPSGGRVRPR